MSLQAESVDITSSAAQTLAARQGMSPATGLELHQPAFANAALRVAARESACGGLRRL